MQPNFELYNCKIVKLSGKGAMSDLKRPKKPDEKKFQIKLQVIPTDFKLISWKTFSEKVIRFQPIGDLVSSLHRVSEDESVRDVPAAQLRPDVRHLQLGVLVVLERTPVVARPEVEPKFSVETSHAVVVTFANLK